MSQRNYFLFDCDFDCFRDLINDTDNRNSGYRMDKHDSLNDTGMGLSLDPYGESFNLGTSKLVSDALRNLPLTELAQKSSQKFKTGFELGKPFFGFSSDRQEKEEGACISIFVVAGLQQLSRWLRVLFVRQ